MTRSSDSTGVGIRREMASGASLSVAGQIGRLAFGLATYVLLTRLLTPSELGIFFSIAAVATFAALAARLGLGPLLIRGISGESVRQGASGGRSAVLRGSAAVIAVSLVLSVAAWFFIVEVLGHGSTSWSFGVTGVMLLFVWIAGVAMEGIVADALRGLGEFGHAAWVVRVGPLAITSVALTILLASGNGATVAQVVVVVAGSSVVVVSSGLLLLLMRLRRYDRGTEIAKIISVRRAFPIWISDLGTYATTNLGLWVLILLGAPFDVAQYGLSIRLVGPLLLPLVVVNTLVAPLIASLNASRDRVTLERVLRSTTTVSATISLVGVAILIAIAPILLLGLFGSSYTDAYPIVVILAVGVTFNVISGSPGVVLLMTGRQRKFAWITVASLLLGAALGIAGFWSAGIVGVAAASSLTTILRVGSMVVVVKSVAGIWTLPYLRPRNAIEATRSLKDVSAVTARWGAADHQSDAESV